MKQVNPVLGIREAMYENLVHRLIENDLNSKGLQIKEISPSSLLKVEIASDDEVLALLEDKRICQDAYLYIHGDDNEAMDFLNFGYGRKFT